MNTASVPILQFLENDAEEREGLGDAGIETFKDAPYASCAREAGQNSRDACAILPVRLTINLLRVPQDQFPDFPKLEAAIAACAQTAEDEKEREFFANALSVVARSILPILEIADYNTTGLTGPTHQIGTPFHSLVKSSGVSTKESRTAGGSFGIGKNASFAVSDLQMVFYSTIYKEPDTDKRLFAAQGKVKLVSHVDAQGIPRRSTGYWGYPDGFRAVLNPEEVPRWMRRSEVGSSIFCVGFRESPDWAEHMTASLISNFFCAVHRNEMTFQVDNGKFQINKNTLESLLTSPEIVAAAEKSGHATELEFATQLYKCLVSPNAVEDQVPLNGLGSVRVRIHAEPGLSRRIGFVRNGMLITDNLKHFGHPLVRFPGARDFIMLVEPADNEAGALLKRLENPQHDGFSAQRIPDPAKRAAAESVMKRLGKKLRDFVRNSAGVEQEDAIALNELGRFFADPQTRNATRDPDAEGDPEKHVFEPPRARPRKRSVLTRAEGTEGGRSQTGRGGGRKSTTDGPGSGQGQGGTGSRVRKEGVTLRNVRNVLPKGSTDGRYRMIYFTPDADGPLALTVMATGIDGPDMVRIESAEGGTIEDGAVVVAASKGQRITIRLTFGKSYLGPLEISAMTTEELGSVT